MEKEVERFFFLLLLSSSKSNASEKRKKKKKKREREKKKFTNLKVRGDERRTRERERERERERAMANENLWKDAEHQLKELDLDLEDDGGYNQWDAAAENEITEDSHWEVRTHTCFSLQLRTPLFIFHAFASVFFPRLTLRMPFFFCVDFFSFFFPLQPRKQYHMRKNANEGKGDAVFNGLEYKAVSVMMPVPVSGLFFIFFSLLPFRSLCLNK